MKKFLALATFGCCAAVSFGQSADQLMLGINAGWYLPTGSIIKRALGAQIFTIGLTPIPTTRPSSGSVTPSFNIIGADKDGSNFLLVPVTLGYEYHFTNDDTATTVPYARIEGGFSYYKYSINEGGPSNVDGNGRFGYVGDAELGLSLNKTIRLNAKYYLFEKESGIDFSGLQLGVTFGLIRL
jgi:hypothetical protein